MKALRSVYSVSVRDWEELGEFHIDCQYYNTSHLVVVECIDGTYIHECPFVNNPQGAHELARRVEERGFIDLAHWGFSEYWTMSFEDRMNAEAEREQFERGTGTYLDSEHTPRYNAGSPSYVGDPQELH